MRSTLHRRPGYKDTSGWSGEEPRREQPLVSSTLTQEAESGRDAVMMSLIPPVGRRAVAVFLGRDDYEKVEEDCSEVKGGLLMECLPRFVAGAGGEIVLTARFDTHDVLNAVCRTLDIDGQSRHVVTEGYVFIHLPDERVVISVETGGNPFRTKKSITIRGANASASFLKEWIGYARENNYLRGRAFFADGEIIEREKKYTWEDILLPEATKRVIQSHVEGFLRNSSRLREFGVKGRRGIILEGPPGTGKTLLGKILADKLNISFMWVSPRHVECVKSFDDILSLARFVAPTVVFLEDLDLFAEDRQSRDWPGLGELMNQLDGAIDNKDVVTIATTNRVEVIEKALRNRPGRFDRVLRFDTMDEPCRRRMLMNLLKRAIVSPEDLEYVVRATEGYTGAQIEELTNTLYILGLEEYNEVAVAGDDGGNAIPFERNLIEAALREVRVERNRAMGFHES